MCQNLPDLQITTSPTWSKSLRVDRLKGADLLDGLAAGEGKLRVASKLVELGADVHFTDRQGRNALDIARAAGYYDLEARLRLLAET